MILAAISLDRSISIHAPTRGATTPSISSTLSRIISIHAPTRGATSSTSIGIWQSYISIHAPTRGATFTHLAIGYTPRYFNPRSYKRSDTLFLVYYNINKDFNPRSYKRSDIGVFPAQDPVYLFQSTLLQEERHHHQNCFHSVLYFNPRSYKRSDPCKISLLCTGRISIHAPTRGATAKMHNTAVNRVFQSTLLQEERLSYQACFITCRRFQSTLLQEERQQKCTIFLMHLCNNYCIVSI